MSTTLPARLDKHESLAEEQARKGVGRDHDASLPDWINVRKQLAFYAGYHRHPVNVAIHIVCIPAILWSALLLFAHLPIPDAISRAILPSGSNVVRLGKHLAFQPNVGLVLNALYCAYYIALEPIAGLLYLPVAALNQLTTTSLATTPAHTHPYGLSAPAIAGLVQVVSWAAQFAGHGFAEGRAPALLDSLLQALVLAPFFSHLEILFLLFNYNPKLQADVKSRVEAELKVRGKKSQ